MLVRTKLLSVLGKVQFSCAAACTTPSNRLTLSTLYCSKASWSLALVQGGDTNNIVEKETSPTKSQRHSTTSNYFLKARSDYIEEALQCFFFCLLPFYIILYIGVFDLLLIRQLYLFFTSMFNDHFVHII